MPSHILARVNAARLAQYKGQTIRLTGKVVRMDGDTAVIEASDGGQVSHLSPPATCSGMQSMPIVTDASVFLDDEQVEIKLHREANISDPYVEILGKVNDDLTVKVFSSMNLGSDLGKPRSYLPSGSFEHLSSCRMSLSHRSDRFLF
jgi:replication factor A3